MTPHYNHLTVTVLMSGHNVYFCDEIENIIPELSNTYHIWTSA